MIPALDIRGLVKQYATTRAVDGLSLRVRPGEFLGLLGRNGAGKTTTIQAIVGLTRFDQGQITVFGHDNVRGYREARRLIGLSPQEHNFDRYLSIRDVLVFTAGYFGIPPWRAGKRADALLDQFGLASKRRENFLALSGGMKRRLSLARALVHQPQILILDEPTAGVDVELRLELWQLMRDLHRDGMTIVLTSHYLEEVERLCKRIAIIDAGKLVAVDGTRQLIARAGEGKRLEDVFLDLTRRSPAHA